MEDAIIMNGNPQNSQIQISHTDEDFSKSMETPTVYRKILREGMIYKQSTAGVCPGYIQANVFMIPVGHSDDFKQFCHANSGPLPLLFASSKGQFNAPTLTADASSDIRTDIPAYKVFENGKLVATKQNLLEFTNQLENYCIFYVGCSFSFDRLLLSAGIPLRYTDGKGTGNVSMYKTNVKCNKRGRFGVELVVSMRPIHREMVKRVIEISLPLDQAHGPPVHIGDPAILGINDLSLDEYYKTKTHLELGEIPVFWACGVTGLEAMKSLESDITFSHCGGSMFITDLKLSNAAESEGLAPENNPRVVWMKEDPPTASVLSEAALREVDQLMEKGNQGSTDCVSAVVAERLLKNVLSLSHASIVDIFIPDTCSDIDHGSVITDGLQYSLLMALFLRRLGKHVNCFCESDKLATTEKLLQGVGDADITLCPLSIADLKKCMKVTEDISNGQQFISNSNVIGNLGSVGPMAETDRREHADLDITVETPTKVSANGSSGFSLFDVETICRSLYTLYTDPIHDRYRRRGLGYPLEDDEKQWLESFLLKLNQKPTNECVQLYFKP